MFGTFWCFDIQCYFEIQAPVAIVEGDESREVGEKDAIISIISIISCITIISIISSSNSGSSIIIIF